MRTSVISSFLPSICPSPRLAIVVQLSTFLSEPPYRSERSLALSPDGTGSRLLVFPISSHADLESTSGVAARNGLIAKLLGNSFSSRSIRLCQNIQSTPQHGKMRRIFIRSKYRCRQTGAILQDSERFIKSKLSNVRLIVARRSSLGRLAAQSIPKQGFCCYRGHSPAPCEPCSQT